MVQELRMSTTSAATVHSNGKNTAPEHALNVLLIEDNAGDARLVEILLEESDLPDCHITHSVTLTAGVAALVADDFDVVLLDLTLPDSRGFETLQRLIEAKPEVNVIVMTGARLLDERRV